MINASADSLDLSSKGRSSSWVGKTVPLVDFARDFMCLRSGLSYRAPDLELLACAASDLH